MPSPTIRNRYAEVLALLSPASALSSPHASIQQLERHGIHPEPPIPDLHFSSSEGSDHHIPFIMQGFPADHSQHQDSNGYFGRHTDFGSTPNVQSVSHFSDNYGEPEDYDYGLLGPLRITNGDEAETVPLLPSNTRKENKKVVRSVQSHTTKKVHVEKVRKEKYIQLGLRSSFRGAVNNFLTRKKAADEHVTNEQSWVFSMITKVSSILPRKYRQSFRTKLLIKRQRLPN
jgi:hypothetical protein